MIATDQRPDQCGGRSLKRLQEGTLEINTRSMDQLRAILIKGVPMVALQRGVALACTRK